MILSKSVLVRTTGILLGRIPNSCSDSSHRGFRISSFNHVKKRNNQSNTITCDGRYTFQKRPFVRLLPLSNTLSSIYCDRRFNMFHYQHLLPRLIRYVNTACGFNGSEGGPNNLDIQGIKRMVVNACSDFYKDSSKSKPNPSEATPRDAGIDFEIEYYDSLELLQGETNTQLPVVCLLHGAPGHYKDYTSLINFLTSKGVRVVAPNFPDYSATFQYSFRHSPQERLSYLIEFFKSLKLNRLDMLVGHSSAVYTLFELLNYTKDQGSESSKTKIYLASLGLFSTPTYNLPRNLEVTPLRLYALKLFDYKLLRPILTSLVTIFASLQGIQNRVDKNKIEDLLIAASAVGYSKSERTADHLKLIHRYKVPTFMLYGCNDRLIPMRNFNQLKTDLGITKDRTVKCYNDSGEVEQDVDEENLDDLVEVSQFSNGGHYVFQKFSDQVNKDVYAFLERKVLPQVESTKL